MFIARNDIPINFDFFSIVTMDFIEEHLKKDKNYYLDDEENKNFLTTNSLFYYKDDYIGKPLSYYFVDSDIYCYDTSTADNENMFLDDDYTELLEDRKNNYLKTTSVYTDRPFYICFERNKTLDFFKQYNQPDFPFLIMPFNAEAHLFAFSIHKETGLEHNDLCEKFYSYSNMLYGRSVFHFLKFIFEKTNIEYFYFNSPLFSGNKKVEEYNEINDAINLLLFNTKKF